VPLTAVDTISYAQFREAARDIPVLAGLRPT
jgi:hypothetical protein